ncbi:hypothetical protein [uncultured Tenacibaculum sp.]|uniref:hypothetical protein n=1 Tax=uncultured Tenacibaculum sp. TaxID=174713 RepID=UPI00262FD3AF|nr:hypothetical protein [uncultured Tenacibaculum sp.]
MKRKTEKTYLTRLFSYSFIFLFLISCYIAPCNLDNGVDALITKKEHTFLVGDYVVEKIINSKLNTENSIINIRKNGTIEMSDISTSLFDMTILERKINVKGNWKLIHAEGEYFLSLSLNFNEKDKIEDYGTSWKLYEKNGRPVFLIKFGDPDECNGVRFIKE